VASVKRRPPALQAREDTCPTADPVPPPAFASEAQQWLPRQSPKGEGGRVAACYGSASRSFARIRETSIADLAHERAAADLKKELRARALARRTAKADARACELVAEHALRDIAFSKDDIVSGYLAMQDELDPAPLMRALDQRGIALALPVVGARRAPLSFRRWHPGDALESGPFGTRHPLPSAEQVRPTVVLAPLLAFDAEGYRLGYGGGYYDRTLAALRKEGTVLAAGLAYAFQEMPALPHMSYDARLDCVVTEKGVRRFGAPGRSPT